MKLISVVCPKCGASIQVDADNRNLSCSYCGNTLILDDEVKHFQFDNAEKAGYEFEKGRQRAQRERYENVNYNIKDNAKTSKKSRTWLWILGWICIFPVPLAIIMWRNNKIKMPVKIAIIFAACLLYLGIGLLSNISDSGNNAVKAKDNDIVEENGLNEDVVQNEESINESKKTQTDLESKEAKKEKKKKIITSDDLYDLADEFIEKYNAVAENKAVNVTKYDIHEEHTRVEYRLQGFDDSVGSYVELSDGYLEVITSMPGFLSDGLSMKDIRIYGSFKEFETAKDALEKIAPVLDPSITVEMIQDSCTEYPENEINGVIRGDDGAKSVYIVREATQSEYKYELFIE